MKATMYHVLHIGNDYAGSTVYRELARSLDKLGVRQTFFTTIRKAGSKGRNAIDFEQQGSAIHYSDNFRPYHRLFFHAKARSNFKALCACVDLESVDIVHAHSLFSDGVLALWLKKKYGIPYVVHAQGTDLKFYMRFMVHTWRIGREVLRGAELLVLATPAYRRLVASWIAAPDTTAKKIVCLPFGVDSYWLDHINCTMHDAPEAFPWQIVYVGSLIPIKNVLRLMQAVLVIHGAGVPIRLDVVGDGRGRSAQRVRAMASAYPEVFELHGPVWDKTKLREILRQSHVFAMPSLGETFGLVYVEALTQGLPILYSHGEGVDGYFDVNYGRACSPKSVSSISNAISDIIEHYSAFSIDEEYLRERFNWANIANKYLALYERVLETTALQRF